MEKAKMPERNWRYPSQEHMDRAIYARFHVDIYFPDWVRKAAEAFLPDKGTPLRLSEHYQRIQDTRKLPEAIHMPYAYNIVDCTVIRATDTIFRVLLRAPWNKRVDIVLVLEGDFEVVTAFWADPSDEHHTLDIVPYEQG